MKDQFLFLSNLSLGKVKDEAVSDIEPPLFQRLPHLCYPCTQSRFQTFVSSLHWCKSFVIKIQTESKWKLYLYVPKYVDIFGFVESRTIEVESFC